MNKLSIPITSIAAFFTLGTLGTAPAQAALFKFSFTSDEANGYILYDNSVPPLPDSIAYYYGAPREYKLDLGDKGVYEGTNGTLVVIPRDAQDIGGFDAPDGDYFVLEVHGPDRQPQSHYTLLGSFIYPKGTFGIDLPTTVPSTAFSAIFPLVDFPNTIGKPAFTGTVQTRIEPVPESTSGLALLGVGVGSLFLFRPRQLRQALLYQTCGIKKFYNDSSD